MQVNMDSGIAKIKPFQYYDKLTQHEIAIEVSPFYSIMRVGNNQYYFVKETGEFDGASTNLTREAPGAYSQGVIYFSS